MELQIKLSNIIQEPEIYDASSNTLLDLVNHLDENSDFTALFDHNPGISGLVNYLCDPIALHMPTCGMVLIKFPFNKWNLLSKGTGELIFFDFPKNEHK
jgi:phosphohistidine phosphatase